MTNAATARIELARLDLTNLDEVNPMMLEMSSTRWMNAEWHTVKA